MDIPGLIDPMVACWMLTPDVPLVELELDAVLTQYRVPVPPGRRVLSHGTAAAGSAEGISGSVTSDAVKDHCVFVEALTDVVMKKLTAARLDRAFHQQVCPGFPALVRCLRVGATASFPTGNAADSRPCGDGRARHRFQHRCGLGNVELYPNTNRRHRERGTRHCWP
jgi:hypothetical protein